MGNLELARELLERGEPLREVAATLGVSHETIRQWAKKYEWKRRERIPLTDGEIGNVRIDTTGSPEIRVPWHKQSSSRGYARVHRYVMAQLLGRPLKPWEHVRHIDGDKLNNDPENLRIEIRVLPQYREQFRREAMQECIQRNSGEPLLEST